MDVDGQGGFDLRDVIIIATAIIAIAGATTIIVKQVLKPMGKWIQRQFREAVTESVSPSLARIEHEVMANDGSSLKDLVVENHRETLSIFDERDKTFARLAHTADRRVKVLEGSYEKLESSHEKILTQLGEISAQIDHKTAEIIEHQPGENP